MKPRRSNRNVRREPAKPAASSAPDLQQGLPPIWAPDARVLILGSMPGEESIRQGQYYAHPRNAFWPIMGALIGAGPDIPYADRVERLRMRRIALWDVVQRCRRAGRLDSAIDPQSVHPNDIADLLSRCPEIRRIFFNGRTAQGLFRRHVEPGAISPESTIKGTYLPSTSPAHAMASFPAKLASWRELKDHLR
jgi:hypoxanthine-DNA glycosylase